jgi:hypothetical protein
LSTSFGFFSLNFSPSPGRQGRSSAPRL